MGDRGKVLVVMPEGSLTLYTHSGGSELDVDVRRALSSASPRFGDDLYWLRIFIDQFLKADRDSEIGSGIGFGDLDVGEDHKTRVVDCAMETVSLRDKGRVLTTRKFNRFVEKGWSTKKTPEEIRAAKLEELDRQYLLKRAAYERGDF